MAQHDKTVRKDVERSLGAYSYEEVLYDCKKTLAELRQYPEENKNQIKYYTQFWNLLSEY